jgi:hypothetical protein
MGVDLAEVDRIDAAIERHGRRFDKGPLEMVVCGGLTAGTGGVWIWDGNW